MSRQHPNDPLHGVTLEMIRPRLVERYGWKELSQRIQIQYQIQPEIFAPHALGPERSGRFVSEFSQKEGMISPDKLKYI